MAEAGFPLPGSSYRELIKIIQGYGRVGSDATLADVAKLTAIGETIVSGNNKFLVAVGIVKGGKKKTITPVGAELATALEHNLPEEIASKWRAVVDATDFLQNVIAAVRIRKSMDESSLEELSSISSPQRDCSKRKVAPYSQPHQNLVQFQRQSRNHFRSRTRCRCLTPYNSLPVVHTQRPFVSAEFNSTST